jgi:hypothetical protein
MSYFIHDGTRQLGHFTIEELKEKGISNTTPVWKEGLNDWVQASSLDELKGAFILSPPVFKAQNSPPVVPLPSASNAEKIGFKLGKFLGWSGLILILFLLGVFIYNKSFTTTFYTSTTIPFVDVEHSNSAQFLAANGIYHPNFWGTKEEISGTVTNSAMHTNYKDAHIKVVFYSQTNSFISSQEYVLYEFVPYGSTKTFSLKLDKPAAAAKCGWTAVAATYY